MDFSVGPSEIAGAIGVVSAVTAFFIGLWIKGIGTDIHDLRDEIHDLVETVGLHSERLAKLETRVDALERK